jgi:hypothetical protein
MWPIRSALFVPAHRRDGDPRLPRLRFQPCNSALNVFPQKLELRRNAPRIFPLVQRD